MGFEYPFAISNHDGISEPYSSLHIRTADMPFKTKTVDV